MVRELLIPAKASQNNRANCRFKVVCVTSKRSPGIRRQSPRDVVVRASREPSLIAKKMDDATNGSAGLLAHLFKGSGLEPVFDEQTGRRFQDPCLLWPIIAHEE